MPTSLGSFCLALPKRLKALKGDASVGLLAESLMRLCGTDKLCQPGIITGCRLPTFDSCKQTPGLSLPMYSKAATVNVAAVYCTPHLQVWVLNQEHHTDDTKYLQMQGLP